MTVVGSLGRRESGQSSTHVMDAFMHSSLMPRVLGWRGKHREQNDESCDGSRPIPCDMSQSSYYQRIMKEFPPSSRVAGHYQKFWFLSALLFHLLIKSLPLYSALEVLCLLLPSASQDTFCHIYIWSSMLRSVYNCAEVQHSSSLT